MEDSNFRIMVNQYEEEVLDEGQQHGVINRNDSRYSYEHLLDENNGGEESEVEEEFIEEIRKLTCLWDTSSKDYKN